MSHFIETLAQTISKNDRSNTKEIKLTQIPFQKIQPATTRLMETFTLITVIKIIDCDLRTLENFPNLPMLTDLYLAQNKYVCVIIEAARLFRESRISPPA